jgi:hypothetical protein
MISSRTTIWCWTLVAAMSGLLWAGDSPSALTRLSENKLPGVSDATQGDCWRCPVETIDRGKSQACITLVHLGRPCPPLADDTLRSSCEMR